MSQGDERGAVGRVKTNALKFRRGVASPRMLRQRREQRPRGPNTRHLSPELKVESPPVFAHSWGTLAAGAD